MEYVGGGDLADKLEDGALPINDAVQILAQICGGVQVIHLAGIIHRDLKPENILLTQDGDVKITDFGIARLGRTSKLTEHGGVVGTIDYVSPEYLEEGHVDARSDIYALGVLAYEMIVGHSPFRGDSVIATMTMRLRSDPAAPDTLREDCPKELSDIILRALQRDPKNRYQEAKEMQVDLNKLAGRLGLQLDADMEEAARLETEEEAIEEERTEISQSVGDHPDASVLNGNPSNRKTEYRPIQRERVGNTETTVVISAQAAAQYSQEPYSEEDTLASDVTLERVLNQVSPPAPKEVEKVEVQELSLIHI